MSAMDPRERVIKAGNELLDTIYEYEQVAPLIDSAKERLEAGSFTRDDPSGMAKLVIRYLTAQAARNDAVRKYVTVRELVEQFDAAAAARGTA